MSARGTAECIHPLSIIANQDHTSPASPFDFAQTWASWRDLRLKDKVLPNQGLHVREIVRRLILCRDPDSGHARHICPGCAYDRRIPFSCKTCFCPSCGKVRVDNWVAYVARVDLPTSLHCVPTRSVTSATPNTPGIPGR